MINLHLKLQHTHNNNNSQVASDNNKQCNNNINISPRSTSSLTSMLSSTPTAVSGTLVNTNTLTNYAISSPGSIKMSLRNKSTSDIVDYNQYYTNSSSSCSFNTNGGGGGPHSHNHNHSQLHDDYDEEYVCDERRHSPSDDYLVTSEDIEKFNKLKSEDLNIENSKWLENKPISVLHLDQPDRAVLKIAGWF